MGLAACGRPCSQNVLGSFLGGPAVDSLACTRGHRGLDSPHLNATTILAEPCHKALKDICIRTVLNSLEFGDVGFKIEC